MPLVLDSFWRAVAYCLHPRVIALSLLPLVIMVALALGLGYFFWDAAVAGVGDWLASSDWLSRGLSWLDGLGAGKLRSAIAPLLVVVAATPVLVLGALFVVAWLMTPSLVSLVAERRFSSLERKHGGTWVASLWVSLGSTLAAVLVLVASSLLWLIPPLILVLPPLIWGWLTYRVMSFDVLAAHASADERRQILRQHRTTLLGMGVLTGYLGAAPSLVWASGALMLALAPVLVPVAIWIYALVFAFAALWFAHFCLAALAQLRAQGLGSGSGSGSGSGQGGAAPGGPMPATAAPSVPAFSSAPALPPAPAAQSGPPTASGALPALPNPPRIKPTDTFATAFDAPNPTTPPPP